MVRRRRERGSSNRILNFRIDSDILLINFVKRGLLNFGPGVVI